MNRWTQPLCQLAYLAGRRLVQDGRIDAGRRLLERVVRWCPHHTDARGLLGWCVGEQGNNEEALRYYRGNLAAQPESAEDLLGLATAAQALGQESDAEVAVVRALDLDPQNPYVQQGAAAIYLNAKRLTDAHLCARRAVNLGPNVPAAYAVLGAVLAEMGRLAEAERSFRTAIELSPEHDSPKLRLVYVLREQARWAETLEILEHLVEAYPPEQVLCLTSDALGRLGRFAEAEVTARQALERFPTAQMPRWAMGWSLFRLGRVQEALSYFEQNAEESPQIAEHAAAVGMALSKLGRHDEARVAFERALALDPEALEGDRDIRLQWEASRDA